MKTAFMGTPKVAVPFLKRLSEITEVGLVLTQPDRPSGRGLKLCPSPVKEEAQKLGLKVLSPERPSGAAADLAALRPELVIVVAYGRILKNDILSVPSIGTLNLHFSLLPAYRGAAPVQWSLIRGETLTGVTAFWIDAGMDTGPIFLQEKLPVLPDENAAGLMQRLCDTGIGVMEQAVRLAGEGKVQRLPQQGEPSYAPLFKTADSILDFSKPAAQVHSKVRGMTGGLAPAPRGVLKCAAGNIGMHILKTAVTAAPENVPPGTVVRVERGAGFIVKCGEGGLLLLEVKPEGKKAIGCWDFVNGFRIKPGDTFAALKQLSPTK